MPDVHVGQIKKTNICTIIYKKLMQTTINFKNIRTWKSSQNASFEELCSQLFSMECPIVEAKFWRKEGAGGDGGVECYWKLPNGDEHCLQAKFFIENIDWSQIEKSVKALIKKHPKTTRYYICLPKNLTDRRQAGRTSEKDLWDSHKVNWQKWVKVANMEVEFILWDETFITGKLMTAKPEYSGKVYYWFNQQLFANEWFEDKYYRARSNLGERYTPESHLDLPIANTFKGLCKTPVYFEEFSSFYYNIKNAISDIRIQFRNVSNINNIKALQKKLFKACSELLRTLESISKDIAVDTSFKTIESLVCSLENITYKCQEPFYTEAIKYKQYEVPHDISYTKHYLSKLVTLLHDFKEWLNSPTCITSNDRSVIILGKAGSGKSHLFADIAYKHLSQKWPVILCLGQHVSGGNPWDQFLSELDLRTSSVDDFLGALDSASQACGVRALILVDAINEGDGKRVWIERLPGFFNDIKRFPRISVAISCRSNYSQSLTKQVPENSIQRITHYGFSGYEHKAAKIYLDNAGIDRPSTPILTPEFSNPLFLKTFCNTLKRRGEKVFPKGLTGVSKIFEYYVDSLEDAIIAKGIDVDPSAKIVKTALLALAAEFAKEGKPWTSRKKAKKILESLYRESRHEKSLLYALLSEGALSDDMHYESRDADGIEIIKFAFERFSDHFIASKLLDDKFDGKNPSKSFEKDSFLYNIICKDLNLFGPGLIEAFSIQIPERCNSELIRLLPAKTSISSYLKEAFLDSLLWRNPTCTNDVTLEVINHIYSRDKWPVMSILLKISTEPQHKFNAEFLHKNLIEKSMPERDAFWSVPIAENHDEEGIVQTLYNWAWYSSKDNIEKDRIRLCAITLFWFLTTPNRVVRDRSTKALVSLLKNNVDVLCVLVNDFKDINDYYLTERLYCVCYGVALLNLPKDDLKLLSKTVYNAVFAGGSPPFHILLRDYARGTIEKAYYKDCLSPEININQTKPPYKSDQSFNIQEETEVGEDYGHDSITSSVSHMGDFGNYIMNRCENWCDTPLEMKKVKTWKDKRDEVIKEAFKNAPQKIIVAYKALVKISGNSLRLLSMLNIQDVLDNKSQNQKTIERIKSFEKTVEGHIGVETWQRIKSLEMPNQNDPVLFDKSEAQKWVCNRAHKLGWTKELFENFERNLPYVGRMGQKHIERIGKKYQWIAYYELLAHLADNFYFAGDGYSDRKPAVFEGSWQISLRNIDPSILIQNTQAESGYNHKSNIWWRPYDLEFVESSNQDILKWLWTKDDIPNFKDLLTVKNPVNGKNYAVLDSFFQLRDNSKDETVKIFERDLWYRIQSCIVKNDDAKGLVKRFLDTDTRDGHDLETDRSSARFFFGEYPWHPLCSKYINFKISRFGDFDTDECNINAIIPTLSYRFEKTDYDGSIDENIDISVPCSWIIEKAKLHSAMDKEFSFRNSANDIIFFDPSVNEIGPGAALMELNTLYKILKDENMAIVWRIGGEKNAYDSSYSNDKWPGRQLIRGAYYIENGNINGDYKLVEERRKY